MQIPVTLTKRGDQARLMTAPAEIAAIELPEVSSDRAATGHRALVVPFELSRFDDRAGRPARDPPPCGARGS